MNQNSTVTKLEIEELKKINKYNKKSIKLLEKGYPIQYLIGYVNFYGNQIFVNKNVLIPRYETEYLIEKTIKYINKLNFSKERLLDLCTGSGAIGLTLKKEIPSLSVDLSDISRKALKIAKLNKNNLSLNVNLIHSDMFKKINNKYSVIISNPPYVMEDEELPKEVKYEPSIALYSPNKGTYHIERIMIESKDKLEDKFLIALEINEKSEEDLTSLIKKYYPSNIKYSFEKDLTGKTRYLFIFNE